MRIAQSLGAVVIVVGVMAFALTSCHKESSNAVTLPGATIDTSLMGQGDQTGQTGQNGQTGNTGATTDPTKWMTKAGDVVQVGIRAIELTFAAALDDQNAKIALIDGKNLDVPLARMRWAADKKSVRLFGAFPACANFTVILKAGSKNAAAETLAADESLTFTTGKNLADLDRSTMCDADVVAADGNQVMVVSGQKVMSLNGGVFDKAQGVVWNYTDPATALLLAHRVPNLSKDTVLGVWMRKTIQPPPMFRYQKFPVTMPPLGGNLLETQLADNQMITPGSFGDLTGDGIGDVVLKRDEREQNNVGVKSILYLDTKPSSSTDPYQLPHTDEVGGVQQNQNTVVARALEAAGDMNGDGMSEIAWEYTVWQGAPQLTAIAVAEVKVIPGNASEAEIVKQTNWKKITLAHGFSVQSMTSGDFNGDGLSDLVVNSVSFNNGNPIAGRIDLIFGSSQLGNVDLNLASNTHLQIPSLQGNGLLVRVYGVGDVNGDGVDDLLMLQAKQSPGGTSLLIGGQEKWIDSNNNVAPLFLAQLQSETGNAYELLQETPERNMLVSGMDLNNDGYADLLLRGHVNAVNAAFVIRGRSTAEFQNKGLFKATDADVTIKFQ